MAELKFELGARLPGEEIVVKVLEIVKVLIEKEPPEAAARRWEWFATDYAKWRKFWKLDE